MTKKSDTYLDLQLKMHNFVIFLLKKRREKDDDMDTSIQTPTTFFLLVFTLA